MASCHTFIQGLFEFETGVFAGCYAKCPAGDPGLNGEGARSCLATEHVLIAIGMKHGARHAFSWRDREDMNMIRVAYLKCQHQPCNTWREAES